MTRSAKLLLTLSCVLFALSIVAFTVSVSRPANATPEPQTTNPVGTYQLSTSESDRWMIDTRTGALYLQMTAPGGSRWDLWAELP